MERKCYRGHTAEVGKHCPQCIKINNNKSNGKRKEWNRVKKVRRMLSAEYRKAATLLLKRFIQCWKSDGYGHLLPKEALPELHEIREEAKALIKNHNRTVSHRRPNRGNKTSETVVC